MENLWLFPEIIKIKLTMHIRLTKKGFFNTFISAFSPFLTKGSVTYKSHIPLAV